MVICLSDNMTVFIYKKLIIILTAEHFGNFKTRTEFKTFNGRNSENKLRDTVFESVKYRRTYTGRNVYTGTLDYTA